MRTLTIEIISDIACPWCAIGYARLERAMQQLKAEINFHIEWVAFELNPDPEARSEPILPALARKYGRSEAEMRESQVNMMQIAESLGLNFSKMQQRYTCNTFDAHRMVKWAAVKGKATQMTLALFDAYFGQAKDISESSVLVACADEVGLDPGRARRILTSNEFTDHVHKDEQKYQQAGITSVPTFIINHRHMVAGAQQPQQFTDIFRQLVAQ